MSNWKELMYKIHGTTAIHICEDCGDDADERYEDQWLCDDCILRRIEVL